MLKPARAPRGEGEDGRGAEHLTQMSVLFSKEGKHSLEDAPSCVPSLPHTLYGPHFSWFFPMCVALEAGK